jgi:hypothetical protein
MITKSDYENLNSIALQIPVCKAAEIAYLSEATN